MFHFRDRDGIEVDLVLEASDRRVAGLEMKSAGSVAMSDFSGLRFLRDNLGPRFAMGLSCTPAARRSRSATSFGHFPIPRSLPDSSCYLGNRSTARVGQITGVTGVLPPVQGAGTALSRRIIA